jgi:hypothetical protein
MATINEFIGFDQDKSILALEEYGAEVSLIDFVKKSYKTDGNVLTRLDSE